LAMKKKILLLLLSATVFCGCGKAQEAGSPQLLQDVKKLSSDAMQGRRTGTPGNRMAQFYILQRYKDIGLTPLNDTYEYPFFFSSGGKKIMGTNLAGMIPGKTNDIMLISAHYDHLGIAKNPVNGDSIYNGADDNASGVAGLLAIAEYFKQQHPPVHTLLFVAFDAEEMGLQGSKAFILQFPDLAKRTRLNINMDMISHNDKGELYACGTRQFPVFRSLLQEAGDNSGIRLLFGHDDPAGGHDYWVDQSDQGSFYKQGIPFIYFGVEDHPDYHRVTDEFNTINPSFFEKAVQLITKATEKIDGSLQNIKNRIPPKSKWIMKKQS